MAALQKDDSPPRAPNQAVLFPAITKDYFVSKGANGYCLRANRRIKKGGRIFKNSLEYSFSDSRDGDKLLFDGYTKASEISKTNIPQFAPIYKETLVDTHGVVTLIETTDKNDSAGTITWILEVPGMLMNHSCDPNTTDYLPCVEEGDAIATRDIERGEELTCDYALTTYASDDSDCWCGSSNCRGKVLGFRSLSKKEQEELFPAATKAVQAMHLAETQSGPPIKVTHSVDSCELPSTGVIQEDAHEIPDRNSTPKGVLRIVCPPPSSAGDNVVVKRNEKGEFALYATKDVAAGKLAYEFWNQVWPTNTPDMFDLVFGAPIDGFQDPPEGTVVHMNARNRARHNRGGLGFSGWELLISHSCDPDIVYDESDDESDNEEGFWQGAYAVHEIKAGDELSVDMNCLHWDRSDSMGNLDSCPCNAETCVGTARGFKFLSPQAKEERRIMSWLRKPPPHKKGRVWAGEALSAHVRAMWRNDPEMKADALDIESSSSESSSSCSESCSSDED